MNDDALKKLWQEQNFPSPPALPDEAQIAAMKKRMTSFDKTIQWRDYLEVAACIFIIFFFGQDLLRGNNSALTQAGCVVLIASAVFIAWKLIWSKRRLPKTEPNAPVFDVVKVELQKVENQIGLLKSVGWWYLLPLFVGVMMCSFGAGGNFLLNFFYFVFVLALYVFIYWLNQRTVQKNLLPLKRALEALLHSAETGEPLDQSHVAILRPIVNLSMGATVKPAEFKVAFWQIAIFGVPGIVGIWFFLMIGLTMDGKDWKAKEQIPKTFVQSVEETSRYSVVARKLVDLFNAGDYDGVQKLYDPEMSEAFPLKETSDFYARLAARFGNIEKFDVPSGGSDGWIAFRLHCQRGELTMSLALDAGDKIAGIYFKPVDMSSENMGSFVRRFFSWQRLIWIVPFFLGGLLYSWLMQQVTKRAVGISTLGIHLCKGQTLVLWDEIKEVRPFRFLHIRNLWLIRESGEKTCMHWTPLERHSDLKAAVENFAPPNHPIRKYLSLLRPESTKKTL